MKYKWLLVDADGTLFDYDEAEREALRRTFEQFGHAFQEQYIEDYRHINGQIWLDFEQGEIEQERLKIERFERLFEAIGVELDAQAFSARYLKNLGMGVDLIQGAREALQALGGEVRMMLITNGLADVQRSRIALSKLDEHFVDVVISEEVGASKPDATIFDVAFERMGHPEKEEVLIVGDSLTSDMRGGSDYGIDTCWFNPHGRARDRDVTIRYEIRSLDELVRIITG